MGHLTTLHRLTTHKFYEMFSGTLILLNAFFLGYQTQYLAVMYRENSLQGKPLGEAPDSFFVLQCIFCFFFSWELGLRWVADGFIDFFKTEDMWWNVLDVVVVGTGVIEIVLEIVSLTTDAEKSDALQNVSVIRVLRVVRIVR